MGADRIESDDELERIVSHEAATKGPRPKLGEPRAINLAEVRQQLERQGETAAMGTDGQPLRVGELPSQQRVVAPVQLPQQTLPIVPGSVGYAPNYGMPTHQSLMPSMPIPHYIPPVSPRDVPVQIQPYRDPAPPADPLQAYVEQVRQQAFDHGRQYERARIRALLEQG